MKQNKLKYYEVPVIGGEFKGRKIRIPDIATTRSSKSILRESLFDTLQFDLIGAPFVEVFAGSGSVGLEALSRGAGHAYFLERNPQVFALLQSNIAHIAPERATALRGDSFELFPTLLARMIDEEEAGYFYFDPPFSIREGMESIYDKTLDLIAQIEPKICRKVIIEHMSRQPMPESIGPFRQQKQKRFGKSALSYYAPISAE